MKKLMAIVLSAALMLSLVACGAPKKDDGKDVAGGKVHVFYYNYGDTYISTVREALSKILTDAKVDFQDYDANSNQTTQTEQIQTAITSGASMLVVNIVETASDDAAKTIIELAKAKDIPVLFFNREVSDEMVNSYAKCAFIGTDAAEAGHMQGTMIAENLLKNYDAVDLNKDGVISYVMFKGQEGNPEATFRTQFSVEDADKALIAGGKKALKFYDDKNKDKYLVDQDGNWSAAAASNYMTTLLTKYNEASKNMPEIIICNNDGMAEGAISALQTAGFNVKDGKKIIPVFGVDATAAAKALIADGVMAGTIKQDSDAMATAIGKAVSAGTAGKELFADMADYKKDEKAAKVRIPYAIYTGEAAPEAPAKK
ncbi:MAG: galactose ABC transporter substrate-binding protein [Oscillospiraceae bacterium]